MDHSIRARAPFTLRNKNTQQECEFDDQAGVDNFRAEVQNPGDWDLVGTDTAAPAAAASEPAAAPEVEEATAAPEAPAAAPAVIEPSPAPTEAPKPARKPRAK